MKVWIFVLKKKREKKIERDLRGEKMELLMERGEKRVRRWFFPSYVCVWIKRKMEGYIFTKYCYRDKNNNFIKYSL